MDIRLNGSLTAGFRSPSQKARILTESWAEENLYCPVCGNSSVRHFPNNREVADFFCPACGEQYELKSKNGPLTAKVPDGAYDTFVRRIQESTNPDFLFMSYRRETLLVHNLVFVPKFFFVPDIAEKRKPLPQQAKRHGWVGCNTLFGRIPEQGRISLVREGEPVARPVVEAQVRRAFRMQVRDLSSRGWLFDVLRCVNSLPGDTFTLDDAYRFEETLAGRYPENHNIRPKIRQQLQVLRDRGVIEFLGRGHYRKRTNDPD